MLIVARRLIRVEAPLYSTRKMGIRNLETAKGRFGLRVKLPPGHLSDTHVLPMLLSLPHVKQGGCECRLQIFAQAQTEIETEPTVLAGI